MDDAQTKPADQSMAELQELVERARAGDAEVLPALRHLLESQPEIWQQCADLGGAVVRRWIEHLSFAEPLVAESLALKVRVMKAEIGGPDPTPLETLLVDRIVVAWLQVQQVDGLAPQLGGLPPKMAALVIQRQKHADRKFSAAVQTLAIVRRLLPSVAG